MVKLGPTSVSGMKLSAQHRLARLSEDLETCRRLLDNARYAPANDVAPRLRVTRRNLADAVKELDLIIPEVEP